MMLQLFDHLDHSSYLIDQCSYLTDHLDHSSYLTVYFDHSSYLTDHFDHSLKDFNDYHQIPRFLLLKWGIPYHSSLHIIRIYGDFSAIKNVVQNF